MTDSSADTTGLPSAGTIEVADANGVLTIALVGEHDLGTRASIEPPLHSAALGEGGVIVDLSRTTFLDSTVLQVLVRTDALLRDRGRTLVLVVPDDGVAHRALEVSGLAETMTCCESPGRAAELLT